MDETNTSRLGHGKDTTSSIGTVFLKIVQNGKNVALYAYTDALKRRFYIGEAPDYSPKELIYKIYYNNGDDLHNGGTVIDNTYQKQLFALANKYNVLNDDLTKTIENTDYIEPDLLLIVSRINKISKAEYQKKYAESAKIELYAGVGANITSYSAGPSSPYTAGGGSSSKATGEELLGGINIILNPQTDRLELHGELSLAQSSFNSSYQLKVYPYGTAKASFSETDFSFEPSVIYNFYNSDNFKFFLGAGIDASDSHYANPFFSAGNNLNQASTSSSAPYNYFFTKINTTFLFKTGIKIDKKYEVFANYIANNPATGGGYFQLNDNHIQAGFIYHFGK
jgi:hypothetical protein